MTRLTRTTLALAALCLSPLACGGGGAEGTPDAGPTGPDDSHWGLADKTCWRFTDSSGSVAYTIEMNLDTATVTGVRTYQLLHRYNGFEQRREWLEVRDRSLSLHRRSVGTPPVLELFTPPATYLAMDLPENESIDTKASVKVASNSGTTIKDASYSVSNVGNDVLTLPSGDVQATKYTQTIEGLDSGQGGTDRIWFAPKVGVVKFNPAGTDIEDLLRKDQFTVDNSHPCNTL